MDEPLGALDKNLRQQMQVEIKKIQADLGLTVIYVTHDQAEALAMSDDVCVIEGGRLVQVGPPRQLYDRPANEFVATFLGEANLFPGKISDVDGAAGVARASGPHGLTSLGRSSAGGATLEVGTPVTIVVRPEDVQIGPTHEGASGFEALVEVVAFVGDALRVQLTADERTTLVARLPKASAHPPQVGSSVNVSWREQDATFVMTAKPS
jgi:putative spermidine/putrescine transport system ATP-binding protein